MCKRALALLMLLILSAFMLGGCRGATPTAIEEGPSDPMQFAWGDRSPFAEGLLPSETGVLTQLADAPEYHIDLLIGDDHRMLSAHQEILYTNTEDVPLPQIALWLFPNLLGGTLDLSQVKVDGEDAATSLDYANSVLWITLDAPLQPGAQVTIGMRFSLAVPTDPGRNYGVLAFTQDVLALAHFYPMLAVYDDEGWNVQIPSEQGDLVYADISFFIVRVSAPSDLVLAASGVEIQRQESDGLQQITFAAGPMRDFYLAASDRYEAISSQLGDVTINSYATSDFMAGAQNALRYCTNALQVLIAHLGSYPFTELDIVGTPNLALGIEYPGIVAITSRLYDPTSSEVDPSWLESTVVHEIVHQWFYSLVGNDQLDEPWLDEALAQYMTMIYFDDMYGASGRQGFRSSLEARWERVQNAEIPIGLPVDAYEGREYGAIVYGRGPLFIEALADTMGEQDFDAFLRDYVQTFEWRNASGEQFKALAEQHCHCDLTPLFTEWVYPD
jgi:hypothetical protein